MMKNAMRTGGVFCILYTEGYMVSFKKGRAAKEILLCLDQSKAPQTVRDVSHDTDYSKGMISRCVEELRKQGYVTVVRDKEDRRAVRISLTDKAKAVIADFHSKESALVETMYAGLNKRPFL